MPKSIKLKRGRQIRTTIGMKPAPTQTQDTQTVERSGATYIRNLPTYQYDLVIESLRDGIELQALSGYFMEQGWLTITERTFRAYLGAFRRIYPELITDDHDGETLNGVVSKRKPKLDEEVLLEQLLRVNERRLRKGTDFEIQTGILQAEVNKGMAVSAQLIDRLAALRGKGPKTGRPEQGQIAMPGEAKEELRNVDKQEGAQEKLAGLFANLGQLLKAKNANKTEA